jgi:hypothetical protein
MLEFQLVPSLHFQEKNTTSLNMATTQMQHLQPGSMKALVWKGNDHVEVERVPIPDIIETTDCIVRITATTIW